MEKNSSRLRRDSVDNMKIPEFQGNLRSFMLRVPEVIRECTGIKIFGKKIR